jgi:hypothetical protein
MLDLNDENFWRSQPTWDLICELLGRHRHVEHIRAALNARLEALGALDLFELVTIEAMHSGATLPEMVHWDPAIVNAGITLPNDDDGLRLPLRLKWISKLQKWAATTPLNGGLSTFGYYATIAEADAAYRALVGLADDRVTEVFVNREKLRRTIVCGQFVPPLT